MIFWLSWPHCGGRLVSKQLKSPRCPLSTSRLSVMRSKWCCMDRSDLSLDGRSDHIWLQRCPTAQIRQSNPSDREDSQPGRVKVRDSNELRIPALTALTTFAHYLCVCVVTKIGENSSITCISFTHYTSYPWCIRAGPLTKWVPNDSEVGQKDVMN